MSERGWVGVVSAAGAFAMACTGPPPAETITVGAPSETTVAVAASAPSAGVPTAQPLPRETDSVQAHFAYLGRMCSPLVRFTPAGGTPLAGCGCCPNYGESCKPHPEGAAITESNDPMLTVDRIFRGAFRRPGVDEALLVVSGCASAAENGGGTWIGEVESGGLRNLAYQSGDHPEACKKLPTEEGIDRLLCTFTHGRAATSTHVLVNDYTRPGAAISARELVEVVSSLPQVCLNGPGSVTDNRVLSTSFRDANADGLADVEVAVALRSGRIGAKALAPCKDGVFEGDLATLLPPAKQEILRFFGKPGLRFEPDPETKRILAKI